MGKDIYQAFNPKTKAWVKYKFDAGGFRPLDVKQRLPIIPFEGIPIRGNKKLRR